MSCIPQSGGCERPFTDPFVEHLNQTENSQYVYRACLDRDSQNPQPEALYVDSQGSRLVIERKAISWPIHYAYGHKKDHLVAERFSKELGPLPSDDLYELRLPMLIEGKEQEVLAFAVRAAQEVRPHLQSITAGSIHQGIVDDKWEWAFRKVPDWEKEEDAPSAGLKFTFVSRHSIFDYVDPSHLPEGLADALNKIYSKCVMKFASYREARRILLLDLHADLSYLKKDWWQAVFSSMPPPPEINEIWSTELDWIDENSQEWVFERLR